MSLPVCGKLARLLLLKSWMIFTRELRPAKIPPPHYATPSSHLFIPTDLTVVLSTGRRFSFTQVPELFEGQTDVIFCERGCGGAGACDVVEFGELTAAIEFGVFREFVQQGSHPPGKALDFPDAAQTNFRVAF